MGKIALIGAGRMGGALLTGWINGGVSPSDVIIVDPKPSAAAQSVIEQGAVYVTALTEESGQDIDTVLLAIKPQMFDALAPDIAKVLPQKACIISILAGITHMRMSGIFGDRPIIRAMPNTPAAIGKGITAFHCNSKVSDDQVKLAHSLLGAGGSVHQINDECLIDAVTAISGSGPAYIFHMAEAMEAAALRLGLPAELAGEFARKTVTGAGALLSDSPQSAADLRAAVTSPNGTTQAALDVLMAELPELMRRTTAAAHKRSKELGSPKPV